VILFSVIIFIILINTGVFLFNTLNKNLSYFIISITLILKLGAAPFHLWFPNVIENINWINGLILITWQKLAPIIILSYLTLTNIISVFVILSTFIGAVGGLNQTSLRKLMAFSSINHIGWIIIALSFNENLWLLYFTLYSFLNSSIVYIFKIFQIFYISQIYTIFVNSYFIKFSLLSSLLSLGGLPPFLGFLPKWIIIQSLLFMKLNLLTLFMIFIRLITLYYYLKISFAALMLNYNDFSWNYINSYKNSSIIYVLNFNFFSLFGFLMTINLIY